MGVFNNIPNEGFEIRMYIDQPLIIERPRMVEISFVTKWWWHLIPGKVERERVEFWKTVDEVMTEMEYRRKQDMANEVS